jgi:hypothetical protein
LQHNDFDRVVAKIIPLPQDISKTGSGQPENNYIDCQVKNGRAAYAFFAGVVSGDHNSQKKSQRHEKAVSMQ